MSEFPSIAKGNSELVEMSWGEVRCVDQDISVLADDKCIVVFNYMLSQI